MVHSISSEDFVMNTFKTVGVGSKKVLLLPGLLGTQDSFDAMLEYADKDTYQYAVMDYRGYGRSKNVPGLYTLREIVTDAVKLLDYLKWTDVTVVGHSFGALVAQMLALDIPGRMKGVVSLAGMTAKGGSRDPARLQLLQDAAQDAVKREAIVTAATGNQYTPGFASAVVQATWPDIAAPAFAGYALDASQSDISHAVEGSQTPILVIIGERDPANTADIAIATTLRSYRHASLEVIPGVGHYPMFEAPARTLTVIERFAAAEHEA
jgi:pimeloyl-ACP methyl ester carboxylesterase